jgi:hypothetical protein
LALTGGGEIVALSTIYDGIGTPSLRRFDGEGSLLANWTSAPGFTVLSSTNGERFSAAGSRLNETRAGRPYASAWIGRRDADGPIWEADRAGIDGSISDVDVIASDASGQLVVGGSLGSAPDSNASLLWLARLDQDGVFMWEESLEVSEASDHSGGAQRGRLPRGRLRHWLPPHVLHRSVALPLGIGT